MVAGHHLDITPLAVRDSTPERQSPMSLPLDRPATAPTPPASRSAVSNGSRALTGIDGRSALARRYRDLLVALGEGLGGDVDETERLQIRNAATLQLHAEDLTARMVRGEPVDPEALSRATNGATRALAALRKRKATRKAPGASLADFLAARKATAA